MSARPIRRLASLALASAVLAGCTMPPSDAEVSAKAAQVMKASFKEAGQAKLDRLDQDETQRLCSREAGKEIPRDVAARIEQINLATIKYPADGRLMGDWKSGERIAQDGRGKQFSDDPKGPVGANCYACHQLSPQELSYGTIGPSLYRFGKIRGFTEETRRYVFGKIYNPEAFAACSVMPRFGHNGILTEQQIRDLVALVLDPASPVNK
jgi:sulfur-oxidizing protein SoxX